MCASFIISIIAAGFSILYQKNISTFLSSYYTKLFLGLSINQLIWILLLLVPWECHKVESHVCAFFNEY